MNKYNIEGGIDFFAELYKSLDIDDCEEKNEDDKNRCLITNQLLTDKYIVLECNHKFNYIPLYNDLVNHKGKFNFMEGTNSKLNINEIRCPYCRNIQSGVLPYYEELGLKKINGVNFYDSTIKYNCYNPKYKTCEFKIPNPNFISSEPESKINKKYDDCFHTGTKISLYNKENSLQPITYGDDKCYCYKHKKVMINNYKLQEKEKQKQAKQLQKAQLKAEKEKAKEDAKIIKQKAKQETKLLNKKYISENIVLGPSIIENQSQQIGCVQILKTGPNKGTPCGCKIISENLCKRHFLMVNKELIINK
jgi:hypothetical protein